MMDFKLIILLACLVGGGVSGRSPRFPDKLTKTDAVSGGSANLSCEVRSSEEVKIIRWFKDRDSTAFYSVDSRLRPLNEADHHTKHSRMSIHHTQSSLFLVIKDVKLEDEGFYYCIVDYKTFITETHPSLLNIIVPPDSIRIYDSLGKEIKEVVGPLQEGFKADLICQVTGGRPSPSLKWWQGSSLLDEKIDTRATNVLRNILTIGPLDRSQLNTKYVCQASNSMLSAPLSKEIRLDLHYKPETVEITTNESALVADEKYKIECISSGGRPPAVITWWLEKKQIQSATHYTTNSGNVTLSTVLFTPNASDGGKKLICQSQSPQVKHKPLTHQWLLDIYYKPKANVTMIPSSDAKEGESVTFNCNVQSNPKMVNITWYHERTKIENKKWENLKIENASLILSKVKRKMSGVYTCVASNQVGIGESNAIFMRTQYIPVCHSNTTGLIGASRLETVPVHCRMDSHPEISAVRWQLNSSGHLIDMPENRFNLHKASKLSVLNYTIKTENDFGTLLCWGSNHLGEQAEPCVFKVVEASLPEKPANCSQVNSTITTVFVQCIPGQDGGLPQTFVAHITDMSQHKALRNLTSEEPWYFLENLPSGTDFLLTIYSKNNKGPSEHTLLQVYTAVPTEDGLFAFPSTHVFPITSILGVLIGVVGALVLVAIVGVVIMRLRSKPAQKQSPKEESNATPLKDASKPKEGSEAGNVTKNETKVESSDIPNKLKHANFYEISAYQDGRNPSEGKNEAVEHLDYAELNFKNKKSKLKPKKKSKPNGKVGSPRDSTIYASIDYVQTEKQKLINEKNKRKIEETRNLLVPAEEVKPAPLTRYQDPHPDSKSLINPEHLNGLNLSSGIQAPLKLVETKPHSNSKVLSQPPLSTEAIRRSTGKPTNLDRPVIPKKPILGQEAIQQKRKRTVETQTQGDTEETSGPPSGPPSIITENFPLIDDSVEDSL